MLRYGYCSVCGSMLLTDHLDEHREDHHPEIDVIFMRLYSFNRQEKELYREAQERTARDLEHGVER